MGENLDRIRGRIKEAAGAPADDDGLNREGKLDQVVGKVKEKAKEAADKMEDALIGRRHGRPGK